MTEHSSPSIGRPSIERHCDVAIVGGAAAGLAAALQLSRQRRSVIVLDAGEPRNAPAEHMHSFLGREGTPPGDLLEDGRNEVRSFGGEILRVRAERVTRRDDGRFQIELANGHTVVARRVIAANGLVDILPDIEGVAEQWGRGVIHCPFCHGYEVRDRRLVQIVTHPMGLHPAALFRQLSERLTIVLHDGTDIDDDQLAPLRGAGVDIASQTVRRVVTGSGGEVAAVELADGSRLDADAVVVGPRFRVNIEPFAPLGLGTVPHPSGLGECVETDALGETSVPGLYAAGNVTDPSHQVLQAAADGSRVGGMVAFSLAAEDMGSDDRPVANQLDWDRRYGGEQLWSGNPNGSLVAEASEMVPGRALDVGAGEGGDAIWLADRGWDVTASDISATSLERIAAEAERREVSVTCLHADANGFEPFGIEQFDLVSAQYASIPRTPDGRAARNLLAAVAPGGTLLVVAHDLAAMRRHGDGQGRAFDPEAYLSVDEVTAALESSPDWVIEANATRPRPPGAASASHHVHDVVLRARRETG